jgi:hypothetical protein
VSLAGAFRIPSLALGITPDKFAHGEEGFSLRGQVERANKTIEAAREQHNGVEFWLAWLSRDWRCATAGNEPN